MRIAVITINREGEKLAKRLRADFPDVKVFNSRLAGKGGLQALVKKIFNQYEDLVFISALGITMRLISGLIKSKLHDPAVVSVDTASRFSISVLSGHEGGANRLAFLVAASLGALPVITTGREVHKRFILGIGTRRGIAKDKVEKAIKKAIKKAKIDLKKIRFAATIELKKNEKGLIGACENLDLPLVFISKKAIGNFKSGLAASEVVRRHIGLDGVCEPCALLAGRRTRLILRKDIQDGVAIAIAKEN